MTKHRPKALLRIGGETILDHIIKKIAGIEAVNKIAVVSNGKFHLKFDVWKKNYMKNARPANAGFIEPVVLNDGSVSEYTRLGAIGDICFALEALTVDEDVLIIAGDNYFTFSLADLYDYYKKMDADCIVVKRHADREALKSLGVAIVAPDGVVTGFEEKPQDPKSDFAVYATYIYKRETLPLFRTYLDEGNPKDAPGNFPAWLYKRKRLVAYAFEGDCYDIGTREIYKEISKIFLDS